MKAIRYHAYGPPEVLRLEAADLPAVGPGDVLIRVRAASVNPLDWHNLRGKPYFARLTSGLTRPRLTALGADLAGVVESVGPGVTAFAPGDEVYGGCGLDLVPGTTGLAEYACLKQDGLVLKMPAGLTFEQAAAVPVAALTALQGLRDKGRLRRGQRVLVNGAAGGVGTFAVQLAKALGAAEVTGVCGTGNVELVRSIGADHVIDYTEEDYTRAGRRYDVVLDLVANHGVLANRRVLTRTGVFVEAAPYKGQWIGPLLGVFKIMAMPRMTFFLSRNSREDLAVIGKLIESGEVTPVIDRTYSLDDAAEAIRYLERGHARGKVVVTP
ncbi:NAD(P)-dependent alcohol dehydrogenase [Nonomuraea gerenzanensis]|uniref:Bifunctional protein: zinc-containing alcohol dehydrogenase quinone oxidoreductase ( NADPH:quinone reductase) Similar to arginate lyase n=1 Tax=Nonomuraea gerenzanensis TaxID=93944 RepID=A0A1M4E1B4_9ACTN|nr:NAD(P)-dependent alcohol dehydrogenase [Nonomuraea gerenzanensis]UBU14873.1 NAD(P)-dependent alcohol dehydrogenase [Nonomuraea gerenzanensis]SBO92607.1 Bifunctional protein: zinc-containing alcohol dehydrogenase; quinone oxidoreductase (NADPH:quinone reductase); Similar to arginate lyase [Nonomuraea gerenzanensis]